MLAKVVAWQPKKACFEKSAKPQIPSVLWSAKNDKCWDMPAQRYLAKCFRKSTERSHKALANAMSKRFLNMSKHILHILQRL